MNALNLNSMLITLKYFKNNILNSIFTAVYPKWNTFESRNENLCMPRVAHHRYTVCFTNVTSMCVKAHLLLLLTAHLMEKRSAPQQHPPMVAQFLEGAPLTKDQLQISAPPAIR
jgi:hypothetical protein